MNREIYQSAIIFLCLVSGFFDPEVVACAHALLLAQTKERDPGKEAEEEEEQKSCTEGVKGALQCDAAL